MGCFAFVAPALFFYCLFLVGPIFFHCEDQSE